MLRADARRRPKQITKHSNVCQHNRNVRGYTSSTEICICFGTYISLRSHERYIFAQFSKTNLHI